MLNSAQILAGLRAGYLALVAAFGYEVAGLDPAMEIVRRQILEYDDRRMAHVYDDRPRRFPAV